MNPYYERKLQRRKDMIAVLNLAKANGCECYITDPDCGYDYGYMIFPDNTVMYIQNGDFWGFDFAIEYKPSRENGTGCRCNDESICTIDWAELLTQKAEGLAFAKKLGAKLYYNAYEWKSRQWNFEKLIKL